MHVFQQSLQKLHIQTGLTELIGAALHKMALTGAIMIRLAVTFKTQVIGSEIGPGEDSLDASFEFSQAPTKEPSHGTR